MSFEAFCQFRESEARSGPRELDRVALKAPAVSDDGDLLPAGREGTVLSVHGDGAAYVIEFAEPVGALATVRGSDLRPLPRTGA